MFLALELSAIIFPYSKLEIRVFIQLWHNRCRLAGLLAHTPKISISTLLLEHRASSKGLLKSEILGLCSGPPEFESLCDLQRNPHFNKLLWQFLTVPIFENY